MKKQLLFLAAVLITSFQFLNAQCSRSGTFVQSDPAYSISGSANITFTTAGLKDVIFESNFETVQGADLRVYLSKTDDINTTGSDAIQISGQLENDSGGFGGPGTAPITGMMTFSIPTSTNLNDFDFIVIQCISINERWGHVTLGTQVGADCSSLSIKDNAFLELSMYPNPAKNKVTIKSNANEEDVEIFVYDILGKLVSQKKQNLNSDLDISDMKSGIYIIKVSSKSKEATKRLVIE